MSTQIPSYRVKVTEAANGQLLAEQIFTGGPGSATAFVSCTWGNTTLTVRQKTFEGDVFVTAREGGSARHASANPSTLATVCQGSGNFEVQVEKLPKTQWCMGEEIPFQAPKVIITAEQGGWRITFEPRQYPCVLTAVVDSQLTKPEALPSFPFPSNPLHARGSYLLRAGQFGAAEGGLLRLGVRGAGQSVTVPLPVVGQTVEVAPKQFKVLGASNAEHLSEAYVVEKYLEKATEGLILYS